MAQSLARRGAPSHFPHMRRQHAGRSAPMRHRTWRLLALGLSVACLACSSFQLAVEAPSPADAVQLSVPRGFVTLRGQPRSDSSQTVTCHASSVVGRFVGQRGDTILLRDAVAVTPAGGSSGHCGFRLSGEVFGADGATPVLATRQFSPLRTMLVVAVVGAVAMLIANAEWEYGPSPGSGSGCTGFLCLRLEPGAPPLSPRASRPASSAR